MEPSAELPMPQSVHAVMPAGRPARLVGGTAGRGDRPQFWPGAVSAALATSPDTVDRALRTLAQRDLVREQPDSSMAAEPEYRFRHVLVSDVCYERLPLAERIARHTRVADWLELRGTELADVVAHHRYTAYESAVALGLDPDPYAAPALAALLHAGRRATMVNAYDVAAAQVARAENLIATTRAPGPAGEPAADRLGVELLAAELALHQDADGFLGGPGPARLAELANLLSRARDHGGAARAWTLLGQIAWLGRDRPAALRCLDRAVELFDSWPDTPEKAQTYAELGRLHMINYEHVPALGAAQIAAEIAERLGLVELRANALITMGLCRFQSGDPAGLGDLQACLEFCRTHQLPSERRAAQSLASDTENLLVRSAVEALAMAAKAGQVVAGTGSWRWPTHTWTRPPRRPGGRRRPPGAGHAAGCGPAGRPAGAAEDVAQAGRPPGQRVLAADLDRPRPRRACGPCRSAPMTPSACCASCRRWRRMRTIASGEAGGGRRPRRAASARTPHLLQDALTEAPHQTAWSSGAGQRQRHPGRDPGDHTAAALHHLTPSATPRRAARPTGCWPWRGGPVPEARPTPARRESAGRPAANRAGRTARDELTAFCRNGIVSAL